MLEIYVYFRSAPAQAGQVQAALARQRSLAGLAGIQGFRSGLRLEAPERPREFLTWLEVYCFASLPDGGWPSARLAMIEACAQRSGLAALAVQERHAEVFVTAVPPVPPDAG